MYRFMITGRVDETTDIFEYLRLLTITNLFVFNKNHADERRQVNCSQKDLLLSGIELMTVRVCGHNVKFCNTSDLNRQEKQSIVTIH